MSELEHYALHNLEWREKPGDPYAVCFISLAPGHQSLHVFRQRQRTNEYAKTGNYCMRGYAIHDDLDPIMCQALIYHYVTVTHRGIDP